MRILHVDSLGKIEILPAFPETWHANALPKTELIWLDLTHAEDNDAIEKLLHEQFGFHPLAIDDALHETHVPKVDDWDTYLYMVLQDVVYQSETQQVHLPELDVFLGKQFLVTHHKETVKAVDYVWELCQRNTRWLQHGVDHLLYRVIDEMVNHYTAVLEHLESEIVQMESIIFANPTPRVLEQLTVYKHTILQLRRVLAPQREVVNKLSREAFPVIGAKDRLYFRDVYDHLVRLYDLSDNVRDLVVGNIEIYLSVVNNRMNDIMKTLTIMTAMFLPLTFLTGFFGMNFFQAVLPSAFWTGEAMLLLTLLAMLIIPLVMVGWMRHRSWM
ncbi:MAG: magnesium/cobalt transporter CorA [Anaerolineae bacterium]|nr:magnesium/cobalt transporter CorA [Anaerolineae bacterium]